MRYVGAYNGNIDRVSRYHNACSRSESTLEQEACSSDQSKGSGEPKGGDRQFIWRTTENRFIDFCFSPEEEARLKLCHERIIASSWSSLTAKEVADCLLTQREREKVLQLSLLQRVRNFWSYVLSPRGLEESGRRLFRTILPRYEDTVLTAKCFGIGETDFNSRIYFLLVHLWSLHCALQKAGLETLKIKLWDALWDFLTNILIQEGASHTQDVPPDDGVSHSDLQVNEFKIPAVLREQQFTSLGFCVALDEAFEDEDAFPAGQLAHRLWVTVYDAKEKRRDCPELIALTTYSLRARERTLSSENSLEAKGPKAAAWAWRTAGRGAAIEEPVPRFLLHFYTRRLCLQLAEPDKNSTGPVESRRLAVMIPTTPPAVYAAPETLGSKRTYVENARRKTAQMVTDVPREQQQNCLYVVEVLAFLGSKGWLSLAEASLAFNSGD
ncbi:uncharacterized protein EMH_0016240 [Eimeria mitis]|uniref:Uncharacterized protein n=1 Tax=Eimeria mitis TaxID=44415 RepID=U6JXH8_9EIME|nr:uncharacterized protein EMH_0016240 [Eimeria mitis]CDJ28757.1 hypothetical protein, conserved [Eimeria mitis]